MKKLFRGKVALKDMATLTSGTLFAQAFSFAMYPILTRLFAPSDIGAVAVFSSLISIIVVLSPFQFDQILLTSKSSDETTEAVSSFLVVSSIFIFFSWFVSLSLKAVGLSSFVPLPWWSFIALPVFIFPLSHYQVIYSFCLRERQFKSASWASSIAQVVATLFKVIGGSMSATLVVLLSGEFIYGWLCYLNLWFFNKKKSHLTGLSRLKWSRALFGKFRSLIFAGQSAAVLRTLSAYFPVQYVAFIYSHADAGYFSLSGALVSAFSRNVSQSLSQVFLSRFSEQIRLGNLHQARHLFNKTLILGGLLGIFLTILGALVGPQMLTIFLGEKWVYSGEIFSPLLLGFFANIILLPSSAALRIVNRPNLIVVSEMAMAVIWLGAFMFAQVRQIDLVTCLWWVGGLQSIIAISYGLITRNIIQK